jgi:hypothetical protein
MSPDQAGAVAALARLRGEMVDDRAAMARRRSLLAQATVDVPGVRPAVLPRATRADLEELLGMRHFLRHAYGAELDGRRLAAQAERLHDVAPAVEQALDAFDAFLAGAIDAARR